MLLTPSLGPSPGVSTWARLVLGLQDNEVKQPDPLPPPPAL
jgi:hypothetical protein